jgi:putative transcriptional regulator
MAALVKRKNWWRFVMTAKTKFKSPAFEAIHSAAAGLYSVDAIAQETMRSFDETCISRVSDFQPGEIKALRDQLNVSQPVLPAI